MINELTANDVLFCFGIIVLTIALCGYILIFLHIIREITRQKKETTTIRRKLRFNLSGTKLDELVGIAGEALQVGDTVIFGNDGKIYKAGNR